MLSQTMQEIIIYNNDLNAKVFLLIVIALYGIFTYWKYTKLEFDTLSNKILKLGFFVYSRITLFFYPLMVAVFLHLNTTLEEMIILVSGLYGIVFVVTFVMLFIKGFESLLDMLGIDKGGMYK